MSLSGFEIGVGGVTSIPIKSSLVLLLDKAFGEKPLGASKIKANKVAAKAMLPTPKREKVTTKSKSR